jgi:hypothetical protein
VFSILVLCLGCHSVTHESAEPRIESANISVGQLPAEFDPLRTYHYRAGAVDDPRRMLLALWDLGLESRRAWQPLDNLCLDPVGPQFTIEFVSDDPRITEQGFDRADGRLRCATKLIAYTISP